MTAFLGYVESYDVPIVNDLATYRLEISKSAQLDLFERLRVPYPRALVINHPSRAHTAAEQLRFPIVVKPNIGGSGARTTRVDTIAELDRPEILRMASNIASAAGLDVCGIEYPVDARDGQPYFYDVNALSNFVTDAERILGFDPFERLADFIEERWKTAALATAGSAAGGR